jgi:hypothetical protein
MFTALGHKANYALDADSATCFDWITHAALLTKVHTSPNLCRQLQAWLQAGVLDHGQLFPTEEGTIGLQKGGGRAKQAYAQYTLPRAARTVGTFQLGLIVGDRVVSLPRLSSIPRKHLTLGYPPSAYLLKGRDYMLPSPGTTDERWWDRHVWGGQEAAPLRSEAPGCGSARQRGNVPDGPRTTRHGGPSCSPWRDRPKPNPHAAMGLCSACHRQTLQEVVKSDGEPRESKDTCGVRASGGG